MPHPGTVFAAVFVALYVAHSVGDHWVQTSAQSAAKGQRGWVRNDLIYWPVWS